MIIFILILALICTVNLRYNTERNEYLSVQSTNAIKGIFIILVFFSHIVNGYVLFDGWWDASYMQLRRVLGQCVVTMFLFYSGYAICYKLDTDVKYCKNIPKRRIFTTLLRFDISILLFVIYAYMGGTTYGIRKLILTFLGWDGIGNSNWYIFCILWLYLFTYIAFTVFDNRKKAVCVVTLQSIIYMGIMNVYKDSWWWDTTLCYVLGMWYYIYKEKIECFVDENAKTWLCSLGICSGMLCMAYLNRDNVFAYQVMILSFTLLTLFITMHIKIGNRVLVWLGENLFELYILQRLPMKIFRDLGLAQRNRYIYVVVCLLCTIIMSILFKKIISANIQFGNEGKIEKG